MHANVSFSFFSAFLYVQNYGYSRTHNCSIYNQFGNSGKTKYILFATILVRYRWLPFYFFSCYVEQLRSVTYLSMFMYRVRDILIFNKKSSLKMKISCGQWIMRLTLIVMYALCSIGQERVCYIKGFLCRYIFLGSNRTVTHLMNINMILPLKWFLGPFVFQNKK